MGGVLGSGASERDRINRVMERLIGEQKTAKRRRTCYHPRSVLRRNRERRLCLDPEIFQSACDGIERIGRVRGCPLSESRTTDDKSGEYCGEESSTRRPALNCDCRSPEGLQWAKKKWRAVLGGTPLAWIPTVWGETSGDTFKFFQKAGSGEFHEPDIGSR